LQASKGGKYKKKEKNSLKKEKWEGEVGGKPSEDGPKWDKSPRVLS